MTTIFDLPPECLEYIVFQLKSDTATLAKLLRVSHLFFKITVPVLYADPFSTCLYSSRPKLHKVLLDSAALPPKAVHHFDNHGISSSPVSFSTESFLEQAQRQRGHLTANGNHWTGAQPGAALLSSEQSSTAGTPVSAMPLPPSAIATSTTKLNDVSKIKRITKAPPPIPTLSSKPHRSIVPQKQRYTMCRYLDSLAAFDGQIWMVYAARTMNQHKCKHLTAKFYLHIQMTILKQSAHRIQSMVLLPGFISPILPFASKMRALTRLQLAGAYNNSELDHLIQLLRARQGFGTIPGAGGPGLGECNLPQVIVSVPKRKTYPLHLHNSQSHNHNHDDGHGHDQQYPQTEAQLAQHTRLQLLQLIHAMGQPVALDTTPCQDFSLISDNISCHVLERLSKFKHILGFLEGDPNKFLSRCRALQELDFAAFDRNVFSWAEAEKKQWIQYTTMLSGATVSELSLSDSKDRVLNSHEMNQKRSDILPTTSVIPTTTLTIHSPLSSFVPTPPTLVQLKVVRLLVSEWVAGRILQSLLYSFSHSLVDVFFHVNDHSQLRHTLCPDTVARLESEATPDIPFCIDHQFQLPNLRKLRMIRLTNAISIGPNAFEGCPNLESIHISGDIVCGPNGLDVFRMPRLELLELGSGTAHHFRFESLQHSPLLRSLALRDNTLYETPPIGSMSLSPIPWTWTLDYLGIIQMSGRPASHFRFEWIRCCPSLKTLVVDGVAPEALRPNMDDVAKGRCGTQLQTCELQIYIKQELNKFRTAKLLETYCSQVERLKLTKKLYVPETDWKNIDLGLALYVSRKLICLKMLVVQLGHNQILETEMEKYGLVRGMSRQNTTIWCPSLRLKECWIEIMEAGEGCRFFRQKQSWLSPLEELLHSDTNLGKES
ncbi:hypothetical protein BX616_003165 [Lobosporangium transversale]|uniref:Uncharacterized protein n=1 Tax=Lobosporangium transversale TaxID=64571 RepID=A0A1Y2GMS9_9FUNG|nr:hypothetical protein BCR41DRAFT_422081 [Lobosporangium transversale]KAF9916668.1 hypothetical protein BX616_003165 [Lobosporangium transversale]ORZ16060.1 hypothetical protein BCR41DRAFT_422081 [Lobosporangium transversale]|eukprot:XP_021881407.1 hypothetical protein BCR41DRAFT_422081 [Lobosporangium transversale]